MGFTELREMLSNKEELNLGPVPGNAPCEQLGPKYRSEVARDECRRYITQLRKQFGEEPEGCRFRIKTNRHDFGNYLDVVVEFDDGVEGAVDWAFKVEEEAWGDWQDENA